jgi:4-hydroxy-tetrahydrodipicolinate reductase
MINIAINGCNGKMGLVLTNMIKESENIRVISGIDRNPEKSNREYPIYKEIWDMKEEIDAIIDFSHYSNLNNLLDYGIKNNIPLVIATSGFIQKDEKLIEEASKEIPILYSKNMSLGINILVELAKNISNILGENFDIEIIEKHHNTKVDAPSGTACMIADEINKSFNNTKNYVFGRKGHKQLRTKNEIGIHSIRGGTMSGEHTVLFSGLDEMIEIKHTAITKNIFALGAIKGVKFVINKKNGLYSMLDIFNFIECN